MQTREAEKTTGASVIGPSRSGLGGGDIPDASGSQQMRGNIRNFLLTDIGEGIMEVEILQWFVAPGDRVRQFDKICEVQSDKANVEITSRFDGVVRKIHHRVGDMAQTGSVLVDIEEFAESEDGAVTSHGVMSSGGEGLAETLTSSTGAVEAARTDVGQALAAEGKTAGRHSAGKFLATPAVRRLLRELSIDMSNLTGGGIQGTGARGRILKGDVLAYAAANGISVRPELLGPSSTEGVLPPKGVFAEGDAPRAPVDSRENPAHLDRAPENQRPESFGRTGIEEQPPLPETEQVLRRRREAVSPVVVPIRGMQRAMMESMRRSLEVPHMTLSDEVVTDRLARLRSDLKAAAEARGVRLSYLPLIIKATSMALLAFPSLNASLSEDRSSLLQHPDHNIGVAMDTDRGLLVPNIPSVQEKSILEIAEELTRLQRLGAEGKLGEAELTGTTFTLSNIGSIGGTYASPIILHPQVGIGALGRMQRVPRFDPSDPHKVIGTNVMAVSWSADHRVIDGGTLARFSNAWKAYLENPAYMLAETR